jgi:hypothetical protein
MSGIFLSYRRDDSSGWTGRLYEHLVRQWGPDQVFMDIDNIAPGEDFRVAIARTLHTCDVVMVVIGPNWLSARDHAGNRRLDDEGDTHRTEVAAALAADVRVVPVLVGGAAMPTVSELPESLKDLAFRNAAVIDDRRFGSDVSDLQVTLGEFAENPSRWAADDEAEVTAGRESARRADEEAKQTAARQSARRADTEAEHAAEQPGAGGEDSGKPAGRTARIWRGAWRGVPRWRWLVLAVVLMGAAGVALVLLPGGHSPALRGHDQAVLSVAFSPDGSLLASGSADSTVRLWDPATGEPVGDPLTGHDDYVQSVAFSPDGSLLASGSDDNTVRLWDPATGEQVTYPLVGHEDYVLSVAFSPDGSRLASGSVDRTVRLWDPATGKPVGEPLVGHEGTVESVAFSPDGSLLASGGDDNTVRLWDPATGEQVAVITNDSSVLSLAFSPDGLRLALGSSDETVGLWNPATGEQVGDPLTGHDGYVQSVAFSPDGTLLASGSDDKAVRLWDPATGEPVDP